MRPRRPNRTFVECFLILALSINRAFCYGTPPQNNFMSAVKTMIFGHETPPPAFNTSNGQPLRHYAVPALAQPTPPVFAVQPAYPQYYMGQSQDQCNLPQQVGTGPYRIPRWYFDTKQQRCQLFYFSGCCVGKPPSKPNTVVFVPFTLTFTMKPTQNKPQPLPTVVACRTPECQAERQASGQMSSIPLVSSTLIPVTPRATTALQLRPISPPVSACDMEIDEGIGSLNLVRYGFDKQRRMCVEFRYRGSGGTRNHFLSYPECRKICPESPSPCAYGGLQQVPCSPDTAVATTCTGQQFCHVGSTASTTVCCDRPASSVDPCNQPLNYGVGTDNLERWHFNDKLCLPFVYKGLQGNQNNFLSRDSCENQCFINPCRVGMPYRSSNGIAYCSAIDQSLCPAGFYCHLGATAQTSVCCPALATNPCIEPKEEGEGNNYLIRYYFDRSQKQCLPFNYKGTKGGINNFVSLLSCERRCPVWTNPCSHGQPILGSNNKPEICHHGNPCPQNYFCHVGYDETTNVCCPSTGDPCTLPLEQGNGNHALSRFYFNSLTKNCERFYYKGLQGNSNSFSDRKQCETACPAFVNPCLAGEPILNEKTQLPEICDPTDEQSCPTTHFCHNGFYNSSKVCCLGHFDPCLLNRAEGEGMGTPSRRFYFDITTKQCLPFTFFGLKGNANNFLTKTSCEKKCPVFVDPCPNSYFELSSSQHLPVHYAQCDPNRIDNCPNGFWCHNGGRRETSVCCPNAGDPCSFISGVEGMGDQRLHRWTYDRRLHKCKPFFYAGLKGNQNNFVNELECKAKCLGVKLSSLEVQQTTNPCSKGRPIEDESGKARQCSEKSQCPAQHYCHVGLDESTTVCCPVIGTDPCGQPLEYGTGGARLQRWYWNQQRQCCQPFQYCGLKGDQNNFLTRQDCERTCLEFDNPCAGGTPELDSEQNPKQCGLFKTCSANYWCHLGQMPSTTLCCPNRVPDDQICKLPVACGQGNASLNRWYFDNQAGCCKQFVYKGKLGNQNAFLSLEECTKACTSSNQTVSDPKQLYVNVCPFGEPILNDETQRPLECTFDTEQEVCGDLHFCHLGLVAEENQCCAGEPRLIAACEGRVPIESGVFGPEGTDPVQRWAFVAEEGVCNNFTFNGRHSNQNNFLSEDDCNRFCSAINPCKLPVPLPLEQCVPGPGSCGSRPNMFCHIGAVPQTTVCCPAEGNPCLLPMDPGIGDARLERWFYNVEINTCQPFIYAGLKGNANSYLTELQCQDTCVPNPCADGRPFIGADGRPQTCSVSATLNSCPNTYWCHIGAVQQTTVCCPGASHNPCNLPMSTGEGNAALERFYFDQGSKTCKPFIYKGLKGNQNNFLSQRACQLACQPLDNPCIGQPAVTPTGQVLFCSATNREICPVNFWCHLGATPETTVCCPGATNPCSVPLAPGTGNAGLSRWYYNADERQCVPFQYNGKRGNRNSFLSQPECERTCPEQLCLLSIDKGACSGRTTRYAFNRQTSQCVPFEYTNCGGNLNNFLSMADCVATCGQLSF